MQGAYGGLVIIINYASGIASEEEEFVILTENNIQILTEASQQLLTEQ